MTTRQIGRYLLREAVGRGAMGIVYRAEDPFIRRTVAVKVLHAATGSTPQNVAIARERFKREAQSAGGIDHPNIIRILDVGDDGESGEMYIVMEYLPGPSLEKMLHESELDVETAVEIIGQIASGLDAAHARGIVHRDIKPSNILLTKDGTAKLVDFGITHVVSSTLTQDLGEVGTPAYMSPEQITGGTLDARSDLFSLGVLSYEILVGKRPFLGTDAVSIAYAVAHAQPIPIGDANPQLPQALNALFDRILAKNPADRFESGKEFHEALGAALSMETDARPVRPVKVPRRSRPMIWGLAAVATLIACGLLAFSRGNRTIPPPPSPPLVAESSPAKSTAAKSTAAKSTAAKSTATRPPVPMATAPRSPVPMANVTISLAHRVRGGTLTVSLDGVPIFTERFSTSKMALIQTTMWDPLRAPAGEHKLRARVNGDNGKTYVSDTYSVELPRATATELRISFKGDALAIKQNS
jgi:serine/threonine-protein kinase